MAQNDDPRVAEVEARAAVQERSVAEFYERQANLRPTPTQRENDLAKVGALGDTPLEPDGSEPEDEAQARVMQAKIAGGPYSTRSLEAGPAGESGEEPVARRRGRPPNPRPPVEEPLSSGE